MVRLYCCTWFGGLKLNPKMLTKTSRLIGLCSLANFINAADRVLMPITIIPMTDQFKWNLYWQGWILSAFAFGYMSSQIIGTFSTTKYSGRNVLLFSVLLWSISTIITPFLAPSLTALIICRVILGIGEGLGLPTIFQMFAQTIPVDERSRAFGYLVAAGSVGQTIASIVCPHIQWETCFYLFGTLGFLWAALWVGLYTDTPSVNEDIPVIIPKVTNTNVRFVEFLSHWPLWAVYLAHFSMNWSNYIIMQWLPTYLARNLGANKESISLTAVPYIMNSLFGVASGHLADKLIRGKWTVLSVRRLMTTIGLLGPGVFLICFCAVNNLAYAVLLVSISMGLCASNAAGHLSNHADLAPNHAGMTFAVSNTIATIPGVLCGPLTAELVITSHGRWFPVFWLAAGVNFVGFIIYISQSSASQVL